MNDIDWSGPIGGALMQAFAAGCAAASTFWLGLGTIIWRLFFEPRIKALQAENDRLANRIEQLETISLLIAPGDLRAQVQSALSEHRSDTDALRRRVENSARE